MHGSLHSHRLLHSFWPRRSDLLNLRNAFYWGRPLFRLPVRLPDGREGVRWKTVNRRLEGGSTRLGRRCRLVHHGDSLGDGGRSGLGRLRVSWELWPGDGRRTGDVDRGRNRLQASESGRSPAVRVSFAERETIFCHRQQRRTEHADLRALLGSVVRRLEELRSHALLMRRPFAAAEGRRSAEAEGAGVVAEGSPEEEEASAGGAGAAPAGAEASEAGAAVAVATAAAGRWDGGAAAGVGSAAAAVSAEASADGGGAGRAVPEAEARPPDAGWVAAAARRPIPEARTAGWVRGARRRPDREGATRPWPWRRSGEAAPLGLHLATRRRERSMVCVVYAYNLTDIGHGALVDRGRREKNAVSGDHKMTDDLSRLINRGFVSSRVHKKGFFVRRHDLR